MALKTFVLDGFDGYTSAAEMESSGRWADVVGVGQVTNFGRESGKCYEEDTTTSPGRAGIDIPLQDARTVVVGFAFYTDKLPDNATTSPLRLNYGPYANSSNNIQMSVTLESDGKLRVYRGNRDTWLATGTTVLSTGTWYYLEFRTYIHNSSGEYELKIDGVSELSATSVNTHDQYDAVDADWKASIGSITLAFPDYATGDTAKFTRFDDLYILADTVNTAGGFWGDVRVVTVVPSGNGYHRDFTPSTGIHDWAVLYELPGTVVNYVVSSTVTDQITLPMAGVPSEADVKCVAANFHTSIGAGGARCFKSLVYDYRELPSTPVLYTNSTKTRSSHNGYTRPVFYEEDPVLSAAWVAGNLNHYTFGAEVV